MDNLILGDCLQILPTLPTQTVDVVFADPPFNIDYEYDVYNDELSPEEYLAWTEKWVIAAKQTLKPTGHFWVAIGPTYQAELKTILNKHLYWRETVIWHYTFGPRQTKKFTPSWVALHHFIMHPENFVFNYEEVRVPSARQIKYKDKRAVSGGKVPDNVWVLLPNEYEHCFRENEDAWLESRVCGTFKERSIHPCQMPEKILERIIKSSSNEGDMILDPFAGSGTTLIAAETLKRRWIGIELSQTYHASIIERITQKRAKQ